MVNKKDSRSILLNLLQSADSPLSGEWLSGQMEISRVAVWKQIGKLSELGYEIESSRQGYRLTGEPADSLGAHLFRGKERFYCLDETDSTMDYAQTLLHRHRDKNSPPEDFVVTAEEQSAGRGRHSREWLSPRGGLFFTHSFEENLPTPRSYRSSMAALIGLTEILRDNYKLPGRIKWPNDILVNDKKVIGLLPAFSGEGERITRFNLGIGINVNNNPPTKEASSLSSLTGHNLSRSDLMKGYLQKMETYRAMGGRELTNLYNKLFLSRGQYGFELSEGERISGCPREVDNLGRLILDTGRAIFPGECIKTQLLSQGK